jgi:BirA family transcriptional regulator, biotin operon repressor / biotin---[acetyl-CoA-carboxylase] ligase
MRVGALKASMPGREIRCYPALLSTEAEAQKWARSGAPVGAVVVAEYQASPRGRGGLPWKIPARGAGFSVVVKPQYLEHQEGRIYVAAITALSDIATLPEITWPDRAWDGDRQLGAVAVYAEAELFQVLWAVVSFMVDNAGEQPEQLVAAVLTNLDARMEQNLEDLVSDYEGMLATIGRPVTAHLIPMGPNGRRISGTALGVDIDGSLKIGSGQGEGVAVRPQHVGLLEVAS